MKDGVTVGDNFELLAKKIAPNDLLSIDKAIKAITKNGGVSSILKKFLSDQDKITRYGLLFSI